jgi:hypothetical protein
VFRVRRADDEPADGPLFVAVELQDVRKAELAHEVPGAARNYELGRPAEEPKRRRIEVVVMHVRDQNGVDVADRPDVHPLRAVQESDASA